MFLVVQSKNLCPVFKGYDYVLQMFFFFFFYTHLFILTLASADMVYLCNSSIATGYSQGIFITSVGWLVLLGT